MFSNDRAAHKCNNWLSGLYIFNWGKAEGPDWPPEELDMMQTVHVWTSVSLLKTALGYSLSKETIVVC